MKIGNNSMVRIQYQVKDTEGHILDKSEPGCGMNYIHGTGSIIRGLEMELEGKAVGETFSALVKAEDGFGIWDAALIDTVPKSSLPSGVKVEPGMVMRATDGYGQPMIVTVKEVRADDVVLDGNHPLAGKDLQFDVTVEEVREATAEEVAALQSCGDGGCDCGCDSSESDDCGSGGCGSGGCHC